MKFLILFVCASVLFSFRIFSAESNCPAGQYRVKEHRRSGYTKSNGIFVRPTIVKSHCKFLTKVTEYLERRFKNGIPSTWPHAKERPGSWTEEEKERLRETLEEIPYVLLSKKIDGFYRLKKSKDYPNPATSANGIIVLYDSAFTSSSLLGEIVVHELSYQNYLDLSEKERQDYRRATGWRLELKPDQKFYWEGRKDGYIEEDGDFSPEEDFANNLQHFLYSPDKLKKTTSEAYLWFHKRFGESFKLKEIKK
jgi:hypothetical protein